MAKLYGDALKLQNILKGMGTNVSDKQMQDAITTTNNKSGSKTTPVTTPATKPLTYAPGSLETMTVAQATAAGRLDEYNNLVKGFNTSPISVSGLVNDKTTPIVVPQPQVTPIAPVVPIATNPTVNPTIDNTQNDMSKTFQSYLSETANAMNEVPSAEETYSQLEKDLQIRQKEQTVNDLTTTQNTILAQGNADIMAIRNQSSQEGGTVGILSAREDAINRSVAIKVLPIQAQLAAAQGNLTLAQNRLDTLLTLRMKDAETKYTNKIKLLDATYSFMNEQQKIQADAIAEKAAMDWEREKLDITQEHDIELKNVGLGGGNEAPTVKTINGVDMQWNGSSWEPIETGTPTNAGQTPTQLKFLRDTITDAKEIANSGGIITTPLGPSFLTKGIGALAKGGNTSYNKLQNLTDTLKTNILTLATDPNIKKFFGPQMSNADVKLMMSGGTTLNPDTMNSTEYVKEINRIDDLLNRMQTAVKLGLKGQTNIITAPDGILIQITD
jgi:hypothetical protein